MPRIVEQFVRVVLALVMIGGVAGWLYSFSVTAGLVPGPVSSVSAKDH